jgi:hypothetical protein
VIIPGNDGDRGHPPGATQRTHHRGCGSSTQQPKRNIMWLQLR